MSFPPNRSPHLVVLTGTARALPRTRAECEQAPRPCPYVSCRHNLWLEQAEMRGRGKEPVRIPGAGAIPVERLEQSCVLDLVDGGQTYTLEEIGDALGLTHEGARLILLRVLEKINRAVHGDDE